MNFARNGILAVVLFVFAGCQSASPSPSQAPMGSRKLNVLFIVADDQNMHLHCYGDPMVQTPHLDSLAARGMKFQHAYCQYPVCNPSRTSFLSGLHPETTRVITQIDSIRSHLPGVVLMPENFRNHGYFTAAVGKIEHGGHRDAKWDLFDEIKGGADDEETDAAPRQRPGRAMRQQEGGRSAGDPAYFAERATEDESDPENADTRIAAKVCKVLEEHKDQPFFLAAGFHKPHVPHVAPKKYFDLYPLDKIEPTIVPAEDEKDIPPAALASKKNYQPDMPVDRKKRIIRSYMACTTYMDDMVGRVFATMDRLHLWDNTIVVFIGDHGWNWGEHNWWAKASLFEESCNAPLLVYVPGMAGDRSCSLIVEYVDLYPTFVELCALPAPQQGEGRSLVSLLRDPDSNSWTKPAYTMLQGRGRSVRTERYRYTEWNDGRQGAELYDHQNDPHEFTNLARFPEHARTVAEMKQLLEQIPHYPERAAR